MLNQLNTNILPEETKEVTLKAEDFIMHTMQDDLIALKAKQGGIPSGTSTSSAPVPVAPITKNDPKNFFLSPG